jgi:hypothetical protein
MPQKEDCSLAYGCTFPLKSGLLRGHTRQLEAVHKHFGMIFTVRSMIRPAGPGCRRRPVGVCPVFTTTDTKDHKGLLPLSFLVPMGVNPFCAFLRVH